MLPFSKWYRLLVCVLENVLGITFASNGRSPVIYWWLEVLRKFCPEFCWGVHVLKLVNYKCPQTRVRTFLLGVRICVTSSLPKPLSPFGALDIRSILGKFPATARSTLSPQQQQNLLDYEAIIGDLYNQGKVQRHDVVTISVDRRKNLTYKQNYTVNKLPTLTTNSGSLLIVDVAGVVDQTPDNEREYMRFVRNSEKLVAQGFSASVHLFLNSRCAQKASGNAYPPSLLVAVMHPCLEALANFNLEQWPPQDVLSTKLPSCLRAAVAEFAKPCKQLPGKKNRMSSQAKKERVVATLRRKRKQKKAKMCRQ